MPCTDCCPFCETNYENDWHVFIGYDEAKTVWRTAGLWDVISTTVAVAESFAACIFSLLCRLTVEECKDLVMMLWCIWRRRNDKVWDGELQPSNIAVQLARVVISMASRKKFCYFTQSAFTARYSYVAATSSEISEV